MGKNIRGKECGKGITQRKDGRYVARYVHVTDESLTDAVRNFNLSMRSLE